MDYDPWMFEGEPIDGRLSNEIWLHKSCPAAFNDSSNPWVEYVRSLYSGGFMFSGWQWLQFYPTDTPNIVERRKRVSCFVYLYSGDNSNLHQHERVSILAWMLSNMLSSVPVVDYV